MLALTGLASTATAQDRLDRALRDGKLSGQSQRVILRAKPGYDAWARKLLLDRGKSIDAELPSIGAFAVELTPAELDALCFSSVFDGCSVDGEVRPSAAAPRPRRRPMPRRRAPSPLQPPPCIPLRRSARCSARSV